MDPHRKPRPSNRRVLNGRAQQWIDGSLDAARYFTIAKREAHEAARREVVARLQRTRWLAGLRTTNRSLP